MSDDEQLRELIRPVVGSIDLEVGRAAIAARLRRARASRVVGVAAATALIVSVVFATAWSAHNRSDNVSVATKHSVPASGVGDLVAAAQSSGLPGARNQTAMAYDARRHEVVLFGGQHLDGSTGSNLADTWLFDENGWRQVHPPTSPPGRFGATMAYDPLDGTVVLYGGLHHVGPNDIPGLTDTWVWDGSTWRELHPLHVPTWSFDNPLAFDPTTHALTMLAPPLGYPGSDPQHGEFNTGAAGSASRFDRWIWNGDDWTVVHDRRSPPIGDGAYAWNAPTHRMVYFDYQPPAYSCGSLAPQCGLPDPTGTRYSQTWTFDGKRWTRRSPTVAPTSSLVVFSMPTTGEVTVLDGARSWSWGGNDWTIVQHGAPGVEAATAIDRDAGAVILFGAFDDPNMWIGDRRGWTTVTP
jgi:hypothetical protein